MRFLFRGCLLLTLLTNAVTVHAQATDDDEPLEVQKLGKLALALDAGGHSAEIASLCFTRDGKELVTCAPDHIRVWDVGTGQTRKVVHMPGRYSATAIVSHDGQTFAVASRADKNAAFRVYLLSTADWQIQRILDMPPAAKTPK